MNNPPTTSNQVYPEHEHHVLHGTHYRCIHQIPSFMANMPPSEDSPEIENPNRLVTECALLTKWKKFMLLSLLDDWNMKFLYKTLAEALVDIHTLQFITPEQCESVLTGYPPGIRIKFIAEVTQLQQEFKNSQFFAPTFANTYL
ncbi:uncharacterized protein LOC132923680 [Rhopalosiphum padi]|uniref:uncharacterized protein LOC132923680 n=1 Tax=Rhopalosiphum padi TaxID=40932 RepID=UPI00298E401A|nr:uncharacterized protein LOC132923680 [Rhopalosiphum padi]